MKHYTLATLAVQFRTLDPNLGHVSVLEQMTDAGLAYSYGLFRAIPRHHRRKRRLMADAIAGQLERKAQSEQLRSWGVPATKKREVQP